MKKIIALLLAALMCLGLCACGGSSGDSFALAEDDYAFLDGLWYMDGNVRGATLEFVDQGNNSVWESRDENGEAVAAGSFTIVDNNEIKLYDAAGEYQLSLIAQDENTLTMGDSGTAYIRGTTLEGASASNGDVSDPVIPVPDDDISDPVYIDTSSIAGEWYNDATEMTLIIDADGNFSLSDGADTTYGICEFDGTNVTLSADGDTIEGFLDSDSDIGFNELDGYFVYVDDMEPQQVEPSTTGSRTYTDNGDGTTTYKDFDLGVMFAYPTSTITVAEDAIPDAATAGDEVGGCFTVRDVTDWYYAYAGSDEDCIFDYIAGYAASDYATLYGGTPEILDFKTIDVNKDTRLATASANLYSEDADIEVYCILTNQTYSNGDNRIVVGTYFAVFGDTDEMNFLKNSFTKIGACR